MKVFAEIFAKVSFLVVYIVLIHGFLVKINKEEQEELYSSITNFIRKNDSKLNEGKELILNKSDGISFIFKGENNLIRIKSDYFNQPKTLFNSFENKAREMCIYINEKINENKDFDYNNCDNYIKKDYFYI